MEEGVKKFNDIVIKSSPMANGCPTTDEELTLLFENYARIWCEKKTDESVISQIAFDEHSPEVIRVNAILSTLDAFYELYDVTEGDGMYIAPEDRISRWY